MIEEGLCWQSAFPSSSATESRAVCKQLANYSAGKRVGAKPFPARWFRSIVLHGERGEHVLILVGTSGTLPSTQQDSVSYRTTLAAGDPMVVEAMAAEEEVVVGYASVAEVASS